MKSAASQSQRRRPFPGSAGVPPRISGGVGETPPPARGTRALPGKKSCRSHEAAFTLLELLIATAVGAIVLLVVQTTFFGALKLHHTTHARLDADLMLQRALGIVRRDFAGLMLPGGTLSGQLQTTVFSSSLGDTFGERISPDFITNSGKIDGWNPFSEVQRVAYFLAPAADNSGAKDLVRVVQRNLLPVQDEPGLPQIILHGVQEADVSFYDGTAWTDAWDSEASATLPTGLKFRLTLLPPDRSQATNAAFEVVVPVVVTTSQSANEAAAAATP